MSTAAIASAPLWTRLNIRLARSATRPEPSCDADEVRARREFVMEALDRNPDAFQSEADVQNMMIAYPCRF